MPSAVLGPTTAPMPSPYRLFAEIFRREPVLAGLGLGLLLLVPPTVLAMTLDMRTLLDVNVWVKPLKFEAALTLYVFTLAWYAGWLPRGMAGKRWYRYFTAIVAICIVLEMVWLIGAAANGVESHFNSTNAFMAGIYPVMGLLALILTSATLVFGIQILRDTNSPLDPTFRLSVGIGLILTFALTVLVTAVMVSWNSHFVGGNLSDAEAAPLMGWARDGGDLRVAHFFATHAMHIIPAFGLIASRTLGARYGRPTVMGFSALFIFFIGFTLGQALFGQPFLPMFG